MLARAAGNLFWLNRYLQRVENTARLIRVHTILLMDLPGANPADSWLPLVSITGGITDFTWLGTASDEISVCSFLINEANNSGSMASDLQAVSINLRSSRDCMSTELYELIKGLCGYTAQLSDQCQDAGMRQDLLKNIENQSRAIAGAMSSTISRDTDYLFLRIGRLLECADMTSRILDVRSANLLSTDSKNEHLPFVTTQWVSVLDSLSALQMYMKHARKPVTGSGVISFLVQNQHFPQTIHYCLTELARCLRLLGSGHTGHESDQEARTDSEQSGISKLDELIYANQRADIALLAKNKQQLHEYISQLQIALNLINDDIASRYFPPIDLEGG